MRPKKFYEYCKSLRDQQEEILLELKKLDGLKVVTYNSKVNQGYKYSNAEKIEEKRERLIQKYLEIVDKRKEIDNVLFQFLVDGNGVGFNVVSFRIKGRISNTEQILSEKRLKKVERECINYICEKLHQKPQESSKEVI